MSCKRGRVRRPHTTPHKGRVGSERAYSSWRSMLERCYNPESPSYVRYGAVGVTVCPSWHLFDNFKRDMGERPAGRSLDRIDNRLGYSPDNCRWATDSEQFANSKNFRPVPVRSVFGKLTVTGEREVWMQQGNPRRKIVWYVCKCECGEVVSVRQYSLLHGLTRSCGCLGKKHLIGKRGKKKYEYVRC